MLIPIGRQDKYSLEREKAKSKYRKIRCMDILGKVVKRYDSDRLSVKKIIQSTISRGFSSLGLVRKICKIYIFYFFIIYTRQESLQL